MKLEDMNKEELELLSYTKIAELVLKDKKKPLTTAQLFTDVCKLLELDEDEYQNKITDFFHSLTTNKDFILLPDGNWDLKIKHPSNIKIGELYDEDDDDIIIDDDTSIEEKDDLINANEESLDDIDSYDDPEDEDDFDDDLTDLSIVNDDDIDNNN